MDYADRMTDVKQICNTLGRKNIADKLGVGLTSIGNAVADNSFPSKWYVVIFEMCQEHSVSCPLSLFRFNLSKTPPEDPRFEEAV